MALNDTAKNLMLDALAAAAGYVSLHNADPGASGANELSGGSPAYARKAVTWASAASGSVAASNQPVLDVAAGATVAYGGLWSAASGGVFYGSGAVVSETFGAQGTYTLTSISITASDPA